jgi:TPR repeat protein
MRFFLFLIISLTVYAKTPYSVLESRQIKAVQLWESGKNKEAFLIFKKNSEGNHAPSMFYMGLYYLYGFNTVELSSDNAFQYINKSAELGYVNAILQRIILYYYGIGISKNVIMAKRYFNEIEIYTNLLENDSKSFLLTLIELRKISSRKMRKYRIDLIKKILKNKTRLSKVNLVFFYRTYFYYTKFFKKSIKVIKNEVYKANAEAQGLFYEKYSYKLSKKEAFKLLVLAATQGDSNSQYNLSTYYSRRGDNKKHVYWLKKAANSGDILSQILINKKLKKGR